MSRRAIASKRLLFLLIPLGLILHSCLQYTAIAQSGTTTRVSIASDGTQGNMLSNVGAISADSYYVVFSSPATNFVVGDINNVSDIFVHDRQTGQTTRVSIASDGTQSNDYSYSPTISANGRFVAFASDADNLVSDDTMNKRDIFVHDRQTGETTRVSVASDGTQGNQHSEQFPSISADGRFIVFRSYAQNFITGEDNDSADIFVHDRQTGETSCVSISSDGTLGNDMSYYGSISPDGRYVAFNSIASNLVSNDTNGYADTFVHDRQTGQTTRVSVASDGTQGNGNVLYAPSVSNNGLYVVFGSVANTLVVNDTNDVDDIFLRDLQTGQTTRVSIATDGTQGKFDCYRASISPDGRYVVFDSDATNLVSDDINGVKDVFIHDRQTSQTMRVSVAFDGTEGNGESWISNYAPLSADGRYVAFSSFAYNLVSGDTNNVQDVFVRDRGPEIIPGNTLYLPIVVNE